MPRRSLVVALAASLLLLGLTWSSGAGAATVTAIPWGTSHNAGGQSVGECNAAAGPGADGYAFHYIYVYYACTAQVPSSDHVGSVDLPLPATCVRTYSGTAWGSCLTSGVFGASPAYDPRLQTTGYYLASGAWANDCALGEWGYYGAGGISGCAASIGAIPTGAEWAQEKQTEVDGSVVAGYYGVSWSGVIIEIQIATLFRTQTVSGLPGGYTAPESNCASLTLGSAWLTQSASVMAGVQLFTRHTGAYGGYGYSTLGDGFGNLNLLTLQCAPPASDIRALVYVPYPPDTYSGLAQPSSLVPCHLVSWQGPQSSPRKGEASSFSFVYTGGASEIAVDPGTGGTGQTIDGTVLAADAVVTAASPAIGQTTTVVDVKPSATGTAWAFWCFEVSGSADSWGGAGGGTSTGPTGAPIAVYSSGSGSGVCVGGTGFDLYQPGTWVSGIIGGVDCLFVPSSAAVSSFTEAFGITSNAPTTSDAPSQWVGAIGQLMVSGPSTAIGQIQIAEVTSGACSIGPGYRVGGSTFSACAALAAVSASTGSSWTFVFDLVEAAILVVLFLGFVQFVRRLVSL